MYAEQSITVKIDEIQDEMKRTGLWQNNAPDWVLNYRNQPERGNIGFAEWLQFVYLPNMAKEEPRAKPVLLKKNIAPAAARYLAETTRGGKLLQLLIELDSL